MKLDKIYEEKVYAGVLGKIIGVYLGRPFEGWTYERIMEKLGPINYYVNENNFYYNHHRNYYFVVNFCDVYANVKPIYFSYSYLNHVIHIYAIPTLECANTQLQVGCIEDAILPARLPHRLVPPIITRR